MIQDIFVVAGSKKQFDRLIVSAQKQWDYEIKNKMVHRVDSPEQLKMSQPARVFCYGTFDRRSDWSFIWQAIINYGHRRFDIR